MAFAVFNYSDMYENKINFLAIQLVLGQFSNFTLALHFMRNY